MSADEIELQLIVPENQRAATLKDIESAGGKVRTSDDRFRSDDELETSGSAFEPLIIIVSVVSIGYLVRLIQRIWQDTRHSGGQIIDVRNGRCRLRKVEGLDRGTIVLVTESGTTVHRPQELDLVNELVGKALNQNKT
jgi:hypothetical protein